MFGTKVYHSADDVVFILCQTEKDMLQKFLKFWDMEEWSPDIVSGWNIDGFDIPYLYNRLKNVLGVQEAKKTLAVENC